MKLFNDEYSKLNIFKIVLKFLGIFIMIGMSVLFFHNMILKNSRFINKLQNEISNSNLENEFKILFEELNNKSKKDDGYVKKIVKGSGEIYKHNEIEDIRDNQLAIDRLKEISITKNNVEVKFDGNKKNLKRAADIRMLIQNVNDDIVENEIMNGYTFSESDSEFYDI